MSAIQHTDLLHTSTRTTDMPQKVPAWVVPVTLAVGGMLGLAGSLALSQNIMITGTPYLVTVALHVVTLIVGFGAVLVVDWHGVLWMLGRRSLDTSLKVSQAIEPLVWPGVVGLLATGAFLSPDLTSPLTQLKMLMVAVIIVNGAMAGLLRHQLQKLPEDVRPQDLSFRFIGWMMGSAAVSQLGWWGAVLVGFINDGLRR